MKQARQRKRYPSCAESKEEWYKWPYLQNRNRLTDLKEWTYDYGGRGEEREEGIIREFGMDIYTLLYLKSTKTYCIAQGTLFNVMWQPGWEGSLGENGYVYMQGWVPLLSTRNYYNIVNQLCVCSVTQLCLTLCNPMDCSPRGSSVLGDSPGKNTGVGCHALLQGIFPTQGLNPGLPHCRQILYHLSHQGSFLISYTPVQNKS